MEIRLRPGTPNYRRRVKGQIDIWFVAAIIGLVGTWLSGTSIEHRNGGILSYHLSVAATPIAGIVTFLWARQLPSGGIRKGLFSPGRTRVRCREIRTSSPWMISV